MRPAIIVTLFDSIGDFRIQQPSCGLVAHASLRAGEAASCRPCTKNVKTNAVGAPARCKRSWKLRDRPAGMRALPDRTSGHFGPTRSRPACRAEAPGEGGPTAPAAGHRPAPGRRREIPIFPQRRGGASICMNHAVWSRPSTVENLAAGEKLRLGGPASIAGQCARLCIRPRLGPDPIRLRIFLSERSWGQRGGNQSPLVVSPGATRRATGGQANFVADHGP